MVRIGDEAHGSRVCRAGRVVNYHLVAEAGKLPVKGATKLVFLCLCESAQSSSERRSFPGVEALMQWGSVSRARVFELLDDLEELALIRQTKRGQKHQRAEYVVFPEGCCDLHGPCSASDTQDAEQPVDSPTGRTLRTAQGPVFDSQGPVLGLSGSGAPDPFHNHSSVTTTMRDSSSLTSPAASVDEVQAAKNRAHIQAIRDDLRAKASA